MKCILYTKFPFFWYSIIFTENSKKFLVGKRVQVARVDDVIACSRSIGDSDFKDRIDLGPEQQALTCVPEITQTKMESGEMLLLACDGLFDVMSNQEAVDYITNMLKTNENLDEVANSLANEAIEKGSEDNVSVVLVKLC